ncbi:MAG TPA: ADP-ribosylglycohydrolase family protein [Acidimicrobiia bacterium]|nr:ADP-ribosylglycohydrolase family protein [Acidimicrobiia bacterium]
MNPAPGSAPAPAFDDSVAGCLLGGAVGDALGAMVEFDSIAEIRSRYGPAGLVDFPPEGGRITDDTQMTLFTAEGLIRARRRFEARRWDHAVDELWAAYRRWLDTQGEGPAASDGGGLAAEPLLRQRRAPGKTCLSALAGNEPGFVELPVNDSKGCGGVMRVAPVGLVSPRPSGLGIASAALTHGHPSGYLAAGAAADIIARLQAGQGLRPAAEAAIDAVSDWQGHEETVAAVRHALTLAGKEPKPSPEAVAALGQGWVAEEALAIAVYCALTGETFEAAVLAAVNHSGDSDSTGAITGNLLGAAGGRSAVPETWVAALAERAVVERVAGELSACFALSS